jgi:hypothetical protein
MKKLANYIILSELKVMVECYKGQLNATDAINYKKSMHENPAFDPAFNIITDLRETEMNIKTENQVNQLRDFLDFLKDTPVQRKVALLTDKPNQAVLAHLFKEFGKETLIEYEVFSTLAAAIKFVDLSPNYYDLINEALKKLSRTTSA